MILITGNGKILKVPLQNIFAEGMIKFQIGIMDRT